MLCCCCCCWEGVAYRAVNPVDAATVAMLVTVDVRGDDEYVDTVVELRVFCKLIPEGEVTGYILLRGLLILLEVCVPVASVTCPESLLMMSMVYLTRSSPVDDDCPFPPLISIQVEPGDTDATVVTGTDASAVHVSPVLLVSLFPLTRQLVYFHSLQSILFCF